MKYIKYIKELIEVTPLQEEELDKYYQLLYTTSKVMNLTTITEELDVYIKHYYDSILCLKDIEKTENKCLLDIGSGAGFPGIVLKIIYPNLKITLLEPTKKRCDFLNMVIEKIGLKDIEVINDRAENYIKEHRESYDFVTARAVAQLNILSELAIPFVKINGLFIAMKGSNYEQEIEESGVAIKLLGGKISDKKIYDLPNNYGKRGIIKIQKVGKTPNIYPRIFSKIKKNPL